MSFDLVVLAAQPDATDAEVRAMAEVCRGWHHPEGELDERIVVFYEGLRAHYPDYPPFGDDSPWTDTPLSVGIDHVSMHLRFGQHGTDVLELIDELARRHGLTIYDPQDGEVTRPDDARTPADPAMAALLEELRAPNP